MSPLCGNICICIEECRLDKKLVGTARERDDLINVLLMIGGIHHVSDLLSPRRAQRVLLEHAERNGQVVANDNLTVVGRTPPHGSLGFVEPRPDAKPKRVETFTPHINTQLLFKCEGKARRAMIKHNALDPKLVLVQERSGSKRLATLPPAEGFLCAEFANAVKSRFLEFGSGNNEIEWMFAQEDSTYRP